MPRRRRCLGVPRREAVEGSETMRSVNESQSLRPHMGTEEERCADAKKFQRIDDAFHHGDLEALRAAVDDPATVPNGRMPDCIGSCLVYAIYHSSLAFIRT